MEPLLNLLDTGVVYRNPHPNIRSLQAYFPSVVETQPGELLVTFDRGSAMENPDVRSFVTRSVENGESWSDPALLYEPEDPRGQVSTSCRMSRAPDGTLFALFTLFHREDPSHGLANTDTDGFVRTTFSLAQSGDDGRTWSVPRPLSLPLDWEAYETCSPIVFPDTHRCLLPTAFWKNWEGECPQGMRAIAFGSEDSGRTWSYVVEVMNDWANGIAHWEQKQTLLPDGRVLSLCWAYDFRNKRSLNNRYAFSTDRGKSFGPIRESPLPGETCTPLALPDGRVVLIYRRTTPCGLWAHLCHFEGERWVPIEDLPLWGENGSVRSHSSDNTFEQLATLKFGYPQTTLLSDGTLFIVFWCVEDCVSNIRWLRLRVC